MAVQVRLSSQSGVWQGPTVFGKIPAQLAVILMIALFLHLLGHVHIVAGAKDRRDGARNAAQQGAVADTMTAQL